ncbi:hypothetical protein RND71_019196 [Anisodus tanguticus]|uniref:Uncharacterized protein n=1 Tax=Anisodus tanguticus TaxID=243964 RepID=A0AAE1RZR8_9SOLA|nr:hypothetical protein RND71_019196 [Anisodus tanguticus]
MYKGNLLVDRSILLVNMDSNFLDTGQAGNFVIGDFITDVVRFWIHYPYRKGFFEELKKQIIMNDVNRVVWLESYFGLHFCDLFANGQRIKANINLGPVVDEGNMPQSIYVRGREIAVTIDSLCTHMGVPTTPLSHLGTSSTNWIISPFFETLCGLESKDIWSRGPGKYREQNVVHHILLDDMEEGEYQLLDDPGDDESLVVQVQKICFGNTLT